MLDGGCLTRHRVTLSLAGGRTPVCDSGGLPLLDRDDCVLVVIDAPAGFLNKMYAEMAADMVDLIRWLVTLASVLEIPVKVTEEEPERNDPTAQPIPTPFPRESGTQGGRAEAGQVRHGYLLRGLGSWQS